MTVIGTAHVRWVDQLPDRAAKSPPFDHETIAAVLRTQPHRWALLPGLSGQCAASISSGVLRPYRPSGSFQATMRRGCLYARYVGPNGSQTGGAR